MSLSYPSSTLAYHQSRPLTMARNAANYPVGAVVKRLNEFMNADQFPNTVPETEAITLYGMNHGMALMRQTYDPCEPMDPEDAKFVEAYHRLMGPKALRAFYYLLLICTRESRHLTNKHTMGPKIAAKFGKACADFNNAIHNKGSDGTADYLREYPPQAALGDFVDSLRCIFYEGNFSGGGYGGPAWGAVTDCLCNFVHGVYTAEIMLDTVWTLSHNNGPIFNKGMLYTNHSTTNLLRVLDIQRSGQIPEAVLEPDYPLDKYVTPELHNLMNWLKARFPEKVGSYVNWPQVVALGAVGSYYKEVQSFKVTHGASPEEQAKEAAAVAAKKAADEKAAKELAEKLANSYEVMPGVFLPKIKRAA